MNLCNVWNQANLSAMIEVNTNSRDDCVIFTPKIDLGSGKTKLPLVMPNEGMFFPARDFENSNKFSIGILVADPTARANLEMIRDIVIGKHIQPFCDIASVKFDPSLINVRLPEYKGAHQFNVTCKGVSVYKKPRWGLKAASNPVLLLQGSDQRPYHSANVTLSCVIYKRENQEVVFCFELRDMDVEPVVAVANKRLNLLYA